MANATWLKVYLAAVLGFVAFSGSSLKAEDEQLIDLSKYDSNLIQLEDAKAQILDGNKIKVESGSSVEHPGITLTSPQGKWDLSKYEYIEVDVKNLLDKDIRVFFRVADANSNEPNDREHEHPLCLSPHSTGTATIRIYPTQWVFSANPIKLQGMRSHPGEPSKVDTKNVTKIIFYDFKPQFETAYEISNIRVGGQVKEISGDNFLPFIDEFGQFIHHDWPGKTRSIEEMKNQVEKEEKQLTDYPGPKDRNKYGGWLAGPQLKATGFFRVEKYQDKWWFVDPDGYLFWSHGVDCVWPGTETGISDREGYFKDLPEKKSLLGQFYGQGRGHIFGFYKDRGFETFDFGKANLYRKYGDNWYGKFSDMTHRRLKSWGLNTMANWSDPGIYRMDKTPYIVPIGHAFFPIKGSDGPWGPFPDPFADIFVKSLQRRLEYEKGKSIDDPWCIGYFVDNELVWGDNTCIAKSTLSSPADQPAKIVFVHDLENKYQTIEKLNEKWGTNHADWNALLQNTTVPDAKRADEDLKAFYLKVAEKYFGTVNHVLKQVAPNQLYLGSRFAALNDDVARMASMYCDVVSYNLYYYDISTYDLPQGSVDKPIIVGEFHFGALDRGLFHTGLKYAKDQQHRAQLYQNYVEGALRNPRMVGTGWFQYRDEATTGRFDDENYQIGFIDVCDNPYAETIEASRRVGEKMYEYRLNNK